MVTGEIKEAEENIITAMGIPREFLYGGLSATGSGVTLRMLENQLLNYTTELIGLGQWVSDRCGKFLGWETVKLDLEPFKLIDDVQQKAALMNANMQMGGQLMSATSVASMFGQDLPKERDLRMQEQVDEFKFQHELNLKLSELETTLADQARAQASSGQPMYNASEVVAAADQKASEFMSMDDGTKRSQLHSLQMEDPVMYAVVIQRMEEMRTQNEAMMRGQMQEGGGM